MRINQIGVAFGVRRLDAALVVASGFYKLQGQKTRIGFLSIIARESKRTTKAASSRRTPKAVAISCGWLYSTLICTCLNYLKPAHKSGGAPHNVDCKWFLFAQASAISPHRLASNRR